jgi:hypothetical protein
MVQFIDRKEVHRLVEDQHAIVAEVKSRARSTTGRTWPA